jgi:GTPase
LDSKKSIDYKLDNKEVLPLKEWAEECYYGKIEYKLKLINKSKERIQGLITQMKFRLREGNGTCFYEIGLEDSGNPLGLNEEELKQSLDTLHYMTEQIGAEMTILNYHQGKQGLIAEIMINLPKGCEKDIAVQPEVRIGLIGEEGSGKSTLVKLKFFKKLKNENLKKFFSNLDRMSNNEQK